MLCQLAWNLGTNDFQFTIHQTQQITEEQVIFDLRVDNDLIDNVAM